MTHKADLISLKPYEQYETERRRNMSDCSDLWDLLDQVKDPEIPALSLWDMGILRDVQRTDKGEISVTITPTYSGCPAMDVMKEDIELLLNQHGFTDFTVNTCLTPAWTSDWMTDEGRMKMHGYGIAPPEAGVVLEDLHIACPHCGSSNTRVVSEFGSTACKALIQCSDCAEPFDYFKKI